MDRWLYFKYGRSPKPEHIRCEQVKGESPLGPAKLITHNSLLIMGYSWAFWIRSLCCIKRLHEDMLDILQLTKKPSLLMGQVLCCAVNAPMFTAYNPKPSQSSAEV